MTPMTALLAFTAWTLFLVVLVLLYRGPRILTGTPITAWTRGDSMTDPGIIKRITDAHLNCLENLPIFAVLVLAAASTGKLAVVAPFAAYVFYARIGQSVVHMIGIQPLLVTVRATFWVIQIVLFVLMFKGLLA